MTGLRQDILDGRIGLGIELRQESLAARFGVSRMPVRDALAVLANERLVTLRPNRGARVVRLSSTEIAELYDLRVLLEVYALQLALPRMNQGSLDTITHAMARCEIEAGRPDFPEADWRFHAALYVPAERPQQVALIAELRALCQAHRAAYDALRNSKSRWTDDHRAIVKSVRMDDGDGAVQALEIHLRAAAETLLDAMRGEQ